MQAELTARGAGAWDEGAALIARVYRRHYGATIAPQAEELIVIRAPGGRIVAAAGLRDGDGALFSQAYLDRPAHQLASGLLGRDIAAGEMIEVGTLGSESPRAVLPLIATLIRIGQARGKRACIFTASAHLRRLLRLTPLALFDLGPARPERLADAARWGSYYGTDPRVCLIPDPRLLPAPRVRRRAA